MIEFVQGDIIRADVEALVNTVNCVGVMGRGIALQFRKAFPENFKEYKAACDRKELRPGRMFVHDREQLDHPRFIINFPTKRHWKGDSRIEDIRSGLVALLEEIRGRGIRSVAVPALGSGLGGLQWRDVRPLIAAAFRELPDVRVLVYEPGAAPAAALMVREAKVPRMTPGRAALLGLMGKYLSAVMDPFVTLLEIHKLMYFMQESGERLRLRYEKGTYGPYAQNLRHVLSYIDGHFITGYGDTEDRPEKQIEMLPKASDAARKFLSKSPDTLVRFNQVSELISGFESAFGLELLATVHWVATREGATTAAEAVEKTYDWNDRKRMFLEPHIRMAWEVLVTRGWLAAGASPKVASDSSS